MSSSTYSWHDEIHKFQAQYEARNLPVPVRGEFTCDKEATYFLKDKIKSQGHGTTNYYVWDQAHWDKMDQFRDNQGEQVVTSSNYRTPDWNKDPAVCEGVDKSSHQYGNGSDITKIGDTTWSAMDSTQKADKTAEAAEHFGFALDETTHLHVRTGAAEPC